jgi:tetratricopeptide (TPR) repeat protein
MKKYLFLALVLLFATQVFAQTQKGYVKTKGRMMNGQLVPGEGLKGAMVAVKGRTPVLVNKDDGEFSFPISDNQISFDSVCKKGYQLIDAEACSRIYKPSGNPIYFVMETPEQQLQDKLNAERKIRRNLQKQLQEREDAIEALKEQQKISDEEYRQALQKLYQDQESNEQLISDMAKRYSELDYDQLDEFYRKVSYCIENGELTKADSLLNTKGNVIQQIEEEKQKGLAIQEQKSKLKKAEAVHTANVDELAKRCFSYYENFKAQYLNDTAAYYLELRASLDTTNVDWLYDAGMFIESYIADYGKALEYYQSGLRQSLLQYGEEDENTAMFYSAIGIINYYQGDFETAMENLTKSFTIRKSVFGENNPGVAECYNNIGAIYFNYGDIDKTMEYYQKGLAISKACYGENHVDVAACYINLGILYTRLKEYDNALDCFDKALKIKEPIYGKNSPDAGYIYFQTGIVHEKLEDYTRAMEYYEIARNACESTLGKTHPTVGLIYFNIGNIYTKQENYDKAMEYYTQSLSILETVVGEIHPSTAMVIFGMGMVYYKTGDYTTALEKIQKSIEIEKVIFGENIPSKVQKYNTLEHIKTKMAEQEKE